MDPQRGSETDTGGGEASLRAELAEARSALAEARRELEAIHRSRLWRAANVYWSLRRRLAALIRRARAERPAGGPPSPPRDPAPPLIAPSAPAEVPAQRPDLSRHPRQFREMSHISGVCNVCGNETDFYYSDPDLWRESLTCRMCLTTSRCRSIARGLLRALDLLADVRAESLAALAGTRSDRRVAIYDTQVPFYFRSNAYPIPDLLARAPWIDVTSSRYDRDERPGARLGGGAINQNLEKLTFADASFDVVVTSDVMEHVRLDDRAHAEIRRILKPGGIYLFTVPHFRNRETLERVKIVDPEDPSRDDFVLEREYHGDANSDEGRALSYRAYGTDLDGRLNALGFHVEYTAEPVDAAGIRNAELFFCRLEAAPRP